MLICLGLAVGFFVSGISFVTKVEPCREISGETVTFNAEVTEYPHVSENFSTVTITLRDKALPRVDAAVYFLGETAPELKPGDRVRVTGRLKFAGERYGQDWDGNTADDVYLLCYPEGEIQVTGKSPLAFLYFPQDIQRKIIHTAGEVFPEKSAAFLTALITGDQTMLYRDTELYSAMSAAGILHAVSVSGMHVAFLVGFLKTVLRRKKLYSAVALPIVWIFAAVAGGTPAVLRAAFMQSSVLVAPLIKRENDGITSLTAILAILLIINPVACASISLQLSFSAMLGMILITPKVHRSLTKNMLPKKKRGILQKLLYSVSASFSATVGALVFSTPLMAAHFGTLGIYTVFVNILVFWAISACFILGFFACFVGMLWLPLGLIPFGLAADILTRYIIAVIKLAASLPYARVFTAEGYFLYWLIFSYGVFILWFFLRRGKSFRPIIPTALTVCGLCLGIMLIELPVPAGFTAVDVGQGQSLILTAEGSAVVIDCGGKSKARNAGDIVAAELLSSGIRRIDLLCLTHFDDDHINGVKRLMSQVEVRAIAAAPENGTDAGREEIMALAEKQGTEVYIIQQDADIRTGGVSVHIFSPISRTKPELMYLASVNGCDILVTGDADEELEARLLLTRTLPDIDIYVAGHHGSRYSSSEELLRAISAETAVISSGYNSYGHPAKDTLARFDVFGMEVLRTDEAGSVHISLEE